jgi:hypothetical protein
MRKIYFFSLELKIDTKKLKWARKYLYQFFSPF